MATKQKQRRRRQPRPPPGQAVFRAPRWKPVLLAIGALGGEAVGLLMLLTGTAPGPFGAWPVVVVFGIVLVVLFERILRPAVVELTSEGFYVRGPRETTTVRWDDLDDLAVVRTGRSWMVAYKLRQPPDAAGQDAGRRLLARVDALYTGGYHGSISGSRLPMGPHRLHEILDWYWRYPRHRRRLPA
ncbi:MAG: hypothetical protein CL878_04835 [Dehalococcoidia bacterium]|nr:hypothetical protein [Dehalococcoidia bacterium]